MTSSHQPLGLDFLVPDTATKESSDRDLEGLDRTAFDDEPWSDLDPEAFEDPEASDEPMASFGGPVPLHDTRTRERWLQSALRALVAPTLGVDGVLGPRTTEAVARFQRRAKALVGKALAVDGIQRGQLAFWRRSFLRRAIDKQVSFAAGPGGPIRRYVTSERGLAVIVRLHNWMPAHVVRWSNRFIAELEAASPGRDLSDPFEWDQALEDAFVQKICDERKRVKSGSYDGYALALSRVRGSFVGGTEDS